MKKDTVQLFDSHCHIHDSLFLEKYDETLDELFSGALAAGITGFMCVGTDVRSSIEACELARARADCVASVALHPHEAEHFDRAALDSQMAELEKLLEQNTGEIKALGECGLDYFYHSGESIREVQRWLLSRHLELAVRYDLPVVFHVRDAFDDFFGILKDYRGIQGVVHSFTATKKQLEQVISAGLYVGLNGIMTFTKQREQLLAAEEVPLDRLLIETDAPFLTPAPFRGKMCKPEHLRVTAEYLAGLRGETLEVLAKQTTDNARALFRINESDYINGN